MTKAKRALLFLFTLFLLAIAGGMFYLQNFYLPQIQAAQKVVVYVATEDLNPLARVAEESFTKVSLPKEAISPDYVLNFKEVEGMYLRSSMYQGEILGKSRISEEKPDADNNLLTAIVPTYYDDIRPGDLVNVYVLKAEKDTNIFSVETVFLGKKVESVPDETIKTNAGKKFAFSVHVDEQELKRYYAANHGGEILAVRIVNPNLIDIVSGLTSFDPNEIIFKQPDPEVVEEEAAQPAVSPAPTN